MQIVTLAARIRFAEEKMQKVHVHAGSDKVYYVLSGRATVRVGAEQQDIAAGQAVLAPAGEAHGVAAASQEPLTLLVFMAPKAIH